MVRLLEIARQRVSELEKLIPLSVRKEQQDIMAITLELNRQIVRIFVDDPLQQRRGKVSFAY